MKYAIISDIHSNLESFTKFLSLIPKLKINKIICLGDVVGYNTNPNEIINLLNQIDLTIIRGNHDRAVSTKKYSDFSSYAATAVKWTIKNINNYSLTFLNSLDKGPKLINDSFAICHGSALDEDYYIFNKQDTKSDFSWLNESPVKILFYGHTHYQQIFCFDPGSKKTSVITDKTLNLNKNHYYIINPGSIGQPRDGDPRGSFATYDDEKMQLKIYRFEYDIKVTQQKIINNDLPSILASRLTVGR